MATLLDDSAGNILTDDVGVQLDDGGATAQVPLFLILQLMLNQQPSLLMQREAPPPTEPPPPPTPRPLRSNRRVK